MFLQNLLTTRCAKSIPKVLCWCLCRRAVSVCPSVRPSRLCILTKRTNVSSFLDQNLWQSFDGYSTTPYPLIGTRMHMG